MPLYGIIGQIKILFNETKCIRLVWGGGGGGGVKQILENLGKLWQTLFWQTPKKGYNLPKFAKNFIDV